MIVWLRPLKRKNKLFQKQNKEKLRHEVIESIKIVGLNAQHLSMYPHSLSGGQRQRLCIARAICRQPKILICDEITSALDVSTQTQIIELLLHLKKQFKLALLWISHDFSIIEYFCDRLYIMDDGKIIEEGDCLQLLRSPKHPRVQEFRHSSKYSPRIEEIPDARKKQLEFLWAHSNLDIA